MYKAKANRYRCQASFEEGYLVCSDSYLQGMHPDAMASSGIEPIVLFDFSRGLDKMLIKLTYLVTGVLATFNISYLILYYSEVDKSGTN